MQKTTPPAEGQSVTPVPLSPVLLAKAQEWLRAKSHLASLTTAEMQLRKELVAALVPAPKEGTNNVVGFGYDVKVGHKVTRTLDEAALDAVMPQLPESYRVVGNLISYKPAFSMDVYRAMPDEQRKIFEQALTIKDGAPTLEIILAETPATTSPATPKGKRSK